MFFAEVYWGREKMAVRSGLIPYASGLSLALLSVFGKGLDKDGAVANLGNRVSVKALYDWYKYERASLPENAMLVQASSTHHSISPVCLFEEGAWAAVDLLYFGPEIPATYVGEQQA